MPLRNRVGAALGAVVVLVLSSCVGSDVAAPDLPDQPTASFAILDASNGGAHDFYFLPPLVNGAPTITGTFNPGLRPSMRVCKLEELLGECTNAPPVVEFPPGSAVVQDDQYVFSWDTDGPETGHIDTRFYYRLEILLGDEVMGWIELDPQDPNGPGQSDADAYAFRLGETIPVKSWFGTEVLCEQFSYVVECITNAVVDESGANLSLEGEGNKLGVVIAAGSLPSPYTEVLFTLYRIDPDLYASEHDGERCIPLLGIPEFDDCFEITTTPELTAGLDIDALVSICLDVSVLEGIDLAEDQEHQLTMIHYDEDGPSWQALADEIGDCPTTTASLLRVPERGPMRYAALGINALAGLVLPEPVGASDIRFGSLVSSFSRFRYAIPGGLTASSGDNTVIQAGDPAAVTVVIDVLDHHGLGIQNATVDFASSDGTLSANSGVSDENGQVTLTWTVNKSTSGEKVLSASALGLVPGSAPDHSSSRTLDGQALEISAFVVGEPSQIQASPTTTLSGTVGESVGNVQVTLTDDNNLPVSGATVSWSGDGTVTGGTTTDASGTATGEWTLPTTAGAAQITATAGSLSATFDANAAAGDAASLATTGGGSATIGATLPLTVTVTDTYGNAVGGDAVTWSVVTGGGSINGSATTAADGSGSASWTLGYASGSQTARVQVAGLQADYTATASCSAGLGVATIDGTFTAGEWACAYHEDFSANISGGSTPATVYWMNSNNTLFLAVRVQQSSLDKVNDLRFDFDNDGDGVTERNDDVISYLSETSTFLDEHLDQKCVNRNQAGCSVADASVDGMGAVGNDGTHTVFEIEHPLSSGDGFDISRAATDPLGFFLTLRVGNGAQGNTQYPGFRDYLQTVIAGS